MEKVLVCYKVKGIEIVGVVSSPPRYDPPLSLQLSLNHVSAFLSCSVLSVLGSVGVGICTRLFTGLGM